MTSSRSLQSVDSLRLQTLPTRIANLAGVLSLSLDQKKLAIPAQLRLSTSLPTFKKHLKSSLFMSAFYFQRLSILNGHHSAI